MLTILGFQFYVTIYETKFTILYYYHVWYIV